MQLAADHDKISRFQVSQDLWVGQDDAAAQRVRRLVSAQVPNAPLAVGRRSLQLAAEPLVLTIVGKTGRGCVVPGLPGAGRTVCRFPAT